MAPNWEKKKKKKKTDTTTKNFQDISRTSEISRTVGHPVVLLLIIKLYARINIFGYPSVKINIQWSQSIELDYLT